MPTDLSQVLVPADVAAWVRATWSVWALVLARVGGLAWIAPGWSTPALGWRLRLLLTALLAFVLVPVIGPALRVPSSLAGLGQACLVEVLAGAAIGWAAALIVAAARQAGELVGAQAGLSPAALLDPEADGEMTPMGHLYGLIAFGVFLALDGPLACAGALVDSYQLVPGGGLTLSADLAARAFDQVGQALSLALRLAAPVALALVLAGAAIGLLGRAAPSLQILAVALPVRTALGLLLALGGITTLVAGLTGAWSGVPVLGPWLARPTGL
jgi:flagellar biosynthesis protein FliR